jgi:hypothetical protein
MGDIHTADSNGGFVPKPEAPPSPILPWGFLFSASQPPQPLAGSSVGND